jgi:coenzyme F420-reducing hydrogenase alpha subunit
MTKNKTIRVNALARVEGEGGLVIKTKGGRVTEVAFTITEPPRLFEAFLRGRHYSEVPDLTARICGICPLAYMLSASQAMEMGLGLAVDPRISVLRRLIFLGEWIASHSLHIHLLHAPDFFGLSDALEMARHHPDIVRRGLRLKQVGNTIVRSLGGREVHPVNLRLGGFFRNPTRAELFELRRELEWALKAARATLEWTAGFTFPDFQRDYTYLALHHRQHYALLDGTLRTSAGTDLTLPDFERFIIEEQVAHYTALHARARMEGPYLVGPLARFNLNFNQMAPAARAAAQAVGLLPVCANPFKSIVVRSLEVLHACQEALEIINNYDPAPSGATTSAPLATTGFGCTEAPRGICWHRYDLDSSGKVINARIVPPTSQNQKVIEADLRAFAETRGDLPLDQLKWQLEQVVRNHDPCISCSTHLIRLK